MPDEVTTTETLNNEGSKTKTVEDLQRELEEANRQLMVKQNVLKTSGDKVTRLQQDLQAKVDKIRELEERQSQAKQEQDEQLKKRGEYEPILADKDQKLTALQEQLKQAQETMENTQKQVKQQQIQNHVYLKLHGKIREDWVKGEVNGKPIDPYRKALELYPFDALEIDEQTNEPTNEAEVTKQWLEMYPTMNQPAQQAQNGLGRIIGPGDSRKTDIPTDNYTAEMHLIAGKEHLDLETVKRRLTGTEKETWKQKWRKHIESTSERRVFQMGV